MTSCQLVGGFLCQVENETRNVQKEEKRPKRQLPIQWNDGQAELQLKLEFGLGLGLGLEIGFGQLNWHLNVFYNKCQLTGWQKGSASTLSPGSNDGHIVHLWNPINWPWDYASCCFGPRKELCNDYKYYDDICHCLEADGNTLGQNKFYSLRLCHLFYAFMFTSHLTLDVCRLPANLIEQTSQLEWSQVFGTNSRPQNGLKNWPKSEKRAQPIS